MKENRLEFSFTEAVQLVALIAALNAAGVPYSLRRDSIAIEITIKTGY